MKTLLVQAPCWGVLSPPYNIALLKAVGRAKGFDVRCLDANIRFYRYLCRRGEEALYEKPTDWYDESYARAVIAKHHSFVEQCVEEIAGYGADVIGFTLTGLNSVFAMVLAEEVKRRTPQSLIVCGGPHCFKNECGAGLLDRYPFVNAVCLWEGEEVFIGMMDSAARTRRIVPLPGAAVRTEGSIVSLPGAPAPAALDSLPFADYSDFDLASYTEKLLPLSTSRGCLNACLFCAESRLWGVYRSRSADHVFAEMTHQISRHPSVRSFFFNDSLFNGDIPMLEALCDLLARRNLGVTWGGQGLIRKEMTAPFIARLKKAGWSHVSYGLEHASRRMLRKMGKGFDPLLAERVLRDTKAAGIRTNVNIVIGFPGETRKDVLETAAFLRRNKRSIDGVHYHPLALVKGSLLYEHREQFGIACSEDQNPARWVSMRDNNTLATRLETMDFYVRACGDNGEAFFGLADYDVFLAEEEARCGRYEEALAYYVRAGQRAGDSVKGALVRDRIAQMQNARSSARLADGPEKDISVIIPTRQRRDRLRRCLDALLGQDYPSDRYEIIVVDDGSTDGTRPMLEALARQKNNLHYLLQSSRGPAAARNLGLSHARGRIIAFTDDDCISARDWVRKMVDAHEAEGAASAVGGLSRVHPGKTKALVSQFLSDGAMEASVDGEPRVIFFPTCNVSLKKERLNGERFDASFSTAGGEDLEFFWRLFKNGHHFVYKPDIEIFHDCHPTLFSFLRQAYRYGRGNYRAQYLHRDLPLLKELDARGPLSFCGATIVNALKIPRFSYVMGRRLARVRKGLSFFEKGKIFAFFALHKAVYILGNIVEYKKIAAARMTGADAGCAGEKGKRVRPELIIFDATHRCNLSCNICDIRHNASRQELTTRDVKALILQAKQWGVAGFALSGGEPFLRPDIWEICDHAKKIRYPIGILSNGILLDEVFLARLAPYLTAGFVSLSISLDAVSPQIHDDIRGTPGCFARTVRGLTLLSGLKKRAAAVNVNTISIILNENLEELASLAAFCKSFGVNSIQFQPLLANNLVMKERSSSVKYWVPAQRWPVLDEAIDALVRFKRDNAPLVRNSEHNLLLTKQYFRGALRAGDVSCLYGARTMLIAPQGDVTTCFDCYGNVKRESLRSIYHSSRAEAARSRVKSCAAPCLLPCFCD
ncbi:MAG: radical SAM protein [Candidatus Omnitrophica bacterium]|nr:radical SAM protein [Candidatus Omnitrophota bacterium]